ncbi:Txe/YoeB family addiction module toxin [bacterium]|nr:Txe/YoeB family addiction module toxin [bacterium]
MNVVLTPQFEEDFRYWLKIDKGVLKRILRLVEDIKITPFSGIGKPEPLKYDLAKCWSRRINSTHRLVYKIDNQSVILLSCRFHYLSR